MMLTPIQTNIATGLLSGALGLSVGFIFAYKKAGREFDARLEVELREAANFHIRRQRGAFTTMEDVEKRAAEIEAENRAEEPEVQRDEPANGEASSGPVKELGILIDRRGKSIYPISEEEYEANEAGYDQIVLLFFETDGVIAHAITEDYIVDWATVLGTNKLDFDDNDQAHIRNTKFGTDYQIIRQESSYAEKMLGLAEE